MGSGLLVYVLGIALVMLAFFAGWKTYVGLRRSDFNKTMAVIVGIAVGIAVWWIALQLIGQIG